MFANNQLRVNGILCDKIIITMTTQNKIALITGGSRGLGKNMALSIAKKGIDVIITYKNKKDEAKEVVAAIEATGQKASALPLDTADTGGHPSFCSGLTAILHNHFQRQRLDFLVNNAGVGVNASFAETTEAQFDLLMNIHFKGAFFLTQKILTLMNDGGGIINLSTGLTRFSTPGFAAYASMKGAIETLTHYQAQELGTRKIRVNVVAPGAIETDFGGGFVRDNALANQHIASVTALGRTGLPDDIGGVVAFLCTDDARWINAQRIEVSGGMNL
jgi:NAD(P)-dependent dehydrogenase (short-subunit alcohol dehydrogenase family)